MTTMSPGCSPDVIFEIGEAGRHAGDVRSAVAVVEFLDAVHHLAQHLGHG